MPEASLSESSNCLSLIRAHRPSLPGARWGQDSVGCATQRQSESSKDSRDHQGPSKPGILKKLHEKLMQTPVEVKTEPPGPWQLHSRNLISTKCQIPSASLVLRSLGVGRVEVSSFRWTTAVRLIGAFLSTRNVTNPVVPKWRHEELMQGPVESEIETLWNSELSALLHGRLHPQPHIFWVSCTPPSTASERCV